MDFEDEEPSAKDIKKNSYFPASRNLKKLADDLWGWSQRPDSINLCGFCFEYDVDPSKLSFYSKRNEYFEKKLNLAKCVLAARREKMLCEGTLHSKAYDNKAGFYDYFIKEYRREDLEFEVSVKSESSKQVDEEYFKRLEDHMKQLDHLQVLD